MTGHVQYIRSVLSVLVYVLSSMGFLSLWSEIGHFQHRELVLVQHPVTTILATGIAFPFVLGFACSMLVRPDSAIAYWPIGVSPAAALLLRLLIEDVPGEWITSSMFGLVGGGLGEIAIALLGAVVAQRLAKGT
ncbi:MAG: hypothetical protein ACREIH_02595 [Nitrospiraceae bacterium]